MEFKGTKGLQVDLKHNKVLNDNGVLVIANVNDFEGEGKYNTLLFSKAPELLEMLIKCTDALNKTTEYDVLERYQKIVDNANKLITEATTL